MTDIQLTSLGFEVTEYGKTVRKYSDTDYIRFMSVVKDMISTHLDRNSKQKEGEVKNINFHIYTY